MKPHFADIAASAHQLQRAAGFIQQHASADDAVANLPVALAHVEEALDRLATGMTIAAHAVEAWPPYSASPREIEEHPEARALRWHLFHLASRLQGAQESCVEPRRFARTLLQQPAPATTSEAPPPAPLSFAGEATEPVDPLTRDLDRRRTGATAPR